MKKFLSWFFISSLLFFSCLAYPQSETIGNLKAKLATENQDTLKLSLLDDLTWEYLYFNIDSARFYANQTLKFSNHIGHERWIGSAHHSMATLYLQTGEYDSAISHFEKAVTVFEKVRNSDKASSSYNGLGNVFLKRGDYKKALNNYLTALKLSESCKNRNKIALVTGNIALVYHNLHNYEKCFEYNFKSLELAIESGDSNGIAASYNNIANLFKDVDSIPQALDYHYKSLEISKKLNLHSRIAESYNNLGIIYKNLNEYAKAIEYFEKGMEVNRLMDYKDGIVAMLNNIGNMHMLREDYILAVKYLKEGVDIARMLDSQDRLMNLYGNLHQVYGLMQDYDSAYRYFTLYSEIKDSVLNSENSRQMAEMQTIYETNKKQKEIELQSSQIEKQHAEITKQRIVLFAFAFGVIMLMVVAFLIYKGYREKKKAHLEIEKRNVQLEEANSEIRLQKAIIEEKNKDVIDSIHYARRIQQAILPPEKFIRKHLSEFFILYKPKDIVAGDFYWFHVNHELTKPDEEIFFAAADCTGHGVPGAFVSIVANNALNRAVKEFNLNQPAAILDKVNEIVEESFAKSENDIKDGMDVSLCKLSRKNGECRLEYSGANNSMWLLCSSEKNLIEIPADKQPVGKFSNRKPFTNHSLALQPDDLIYIFSDGYADQFGGPKGKKFKYRQFKELVLSLCELSMDEQKRLLEKTIDEWRGDLVQIDDICVIGFKV